MNEFAKQFKGGGHKNAAGISLNKQDLLDVKRTFIESFKTYIN
jgi:nanoRNase/pAp phosphatase (c-di-AMP/oligoRNAs hydrolase)